MSQESERWTDNEILDRWTHLFTGPLVVQQWRANTLNNPSDYETFNRLTEQYRHRLGDLGWFMQCLDELVGHQKNKKISVTSGKIDLNHRLF